jgi:UTP--glucose-1-phosphate uridylyltransferase
MLERDEVRTLRLDDHSQHQPFNDNELRCRFEPFAERMRRAKLPELIIETFGIYYRQLLGGHLGTLSRADIDSVDRVPDMEKLDGYRDMGRVAFRKTVVIKLNGGLATSMGLDKAKSLFVAREGFTFLDIIARQILALRRARGCDLPLVLMNSFNTHDDSLAHLARYPDLGGEIPLGFIQNRVPKVAREGLGPVVWEPDPTLEWCPPGHGDIYTALLTSGMLNRLLAGGYEFVFVSNADNLGAVVDEQILGYFAAERLPFMMEVADRTEADRKGGHLARLKDGRLTLRESAQCPEGEREEFQDIRLYKYFNTNTLWINLIALKQLLDEREGILGLPLIVNRKTVDPRDESSPRVFQLETAMGAGISLFPGAQALRVPRARFAPVKTCDDLLGLRSDAYVLTDDFRVVPNPARRLGALVVRLDPRYYKRIDDFEARFPHGAPSLLHCEGLSIEGDVRFGREVAVVGSVRVVNQAQEQLTIADGTTIGSDIVRVA